MKKIYFFLIISFTVFGQSSNYSIKFISTYNLKSIKFFDQNTGIAAGDSGIVLLTKDSGISWEMLKRMTEYTLRSISLINGTTGFIVGGDYNQTKGEYEGIILKTTDKGENWHIDKTVQYEFYNTIFFINESIGFIAGVGRTPPLDYNPAIKKTTDGGKSWYNVKYPSDRMIPPIFSIKMVNSNIGYACGSSISLKTTDAGETWIDQTAGGNYYWPSMYDQYYFDENNGYQFGDEILKTSDGGNTWNENKIQSGFRSVKFLNNNEAITVGTYGLLNKTTNGGQTWVKYSLGLNNELSSLDIPVRTKGFAVGENGILVTFNFDSLSTNTTLSTLSFIEPLANQIVYNNYECTIKWKTFNLTPGEFKIDYSIDDGKTWKLIINQSNFYYDSYIWNTSNVDTSSYARIRITDLSGGISYVSDQFRIVKETRKLFISRPGGNEILRAGTKITVNWDYDYITNSNIGFKFIPETYQIFPSVPVSQKYANIDLPYDQNYYQLKIFDVDNPQINAISDTFLVKFSPHFEFSKPIGGETWYVDNTRIINIASYNVEYIKLEYSIDSGSTWYTIKDSIHADSNKIKTIEYSWKIPGTISPKCFIKAVNKVDSSVFKISGMFEISNQAYLLKSYFPLEVGNYWQFNNGYDYMKVLCDTTIGSQQQLVKKVKTSFIIAPYLDSVLYLQYDSLSNSIKEYKTWSDSGNVLFNFNASPYEFWQCFSYEIRYYGPDTENIFNNTRLVKTFYGGSIPSFTYYLAEGIGPIKIINDQSWTVPSVLGYDLNYAKINGIEYGELVSVKDRNVKLPAKFLLHQNYPNPFNPNTKIEYSIPKTSFVTLKVYDILGKEVATLVNEEKSVGDYNVEFNGNNLSSGIYFYEIQAGDYSSVKKMILIK